LNFQIKVSGRSPAFSIFTHSRQPDSLTVPDSRRYFDNQLSGLFFKKIRVRTSFLSLHGTQTNGIINVGTVSRQLNTANFFYNIPGQFPQFARQGGGLGLIVFPSSQRTGKDKSSGKYAGSLKFKSPVFFTIKFRENIIKTPESECLGHFLKNMIDIRTAENILLGIIVSKSAVGIRPELLPQCIIFSSFLRGRENRIGFVHCLHFFTGFRILFVSIRMIFKGHLTVSFFNLL